MPYISRPRGQHARTSYDPTAIPDRLWPRVPGTDIPWPPDRTVAVRASTWSIFLMLPSIMLFWGTLLEHAAPASQLVRAFQFGGWAVYVLAGPMIALWFSHARQARIVWLSVLAPFTAGITAMAGYIMLATDRRYGCVTCRRADVSVLDAPHVAGMRNGGR